MTCYDLAAHTETTYLAGTPIDQIAGVEQKLTVVGDEPATFLQLVATPRFATSE